MVILCYSQPVYIYHVFFFLEENVLLGGCNSLAVRFVHLGTGSIIDMFQILSPYIVL